MYNDPLCLKTCFFPQECILLHNLRPHGPQGSADMDVIDYLCTVSRGF